MSFLVKGWSEEEGRQRGIPGTTLLTLLHCYLLLVSSSLSKKASHSSLWSSSASKGHRRTVLNMLLLSSAEYQPHLQPDLSLSYGSVPSCHSSRSQLAGVDIRFKTERPCFCIHLFYRVMLNPANFVSHKSSHWHWDFADWISKLVDNYFSISVIPVGRIYSQYTVHNIIHAYSSSSACSSSLPFSSSFPVPWGLYLHES